MGNSTSKRRNSGIQMTVCKSIGGTEDKVETTETPAEGYLLDPRSPNVARTPICEVLAGRFKSNENEITESIPNNLLRNRLLRELGVEQSAKMTDILDPRSPSRLIPRTPLNLSFQSDDGMDNSRIVSLEYDGLIEEASCRNFNEKLANITLDDAGYEDARETASTDDEFVDTELAAIRQKYLEPNFDFVGDEIQLKPDPRSPSENVCRTPLLAPIAKSIFATVTKEDLVGAENISPMVDSDKQRAMPIHSSTPMVVSVPILDEILPVKLIKARIYEDELIPENSVGSTQTDIEIVIHTPLKRIAKMNDENDSQPRTPLGVINRRGKKIDNLLQSNSRADKSSKFAILNDENCTPQRSMQNENRLSIRSSSKIPIFKK